MLKMNELPSTFSVVAVYRVYASLKVVLHFDDCKYGKPIVADVLQSLVPISVLDK